MAVEYEKRLHRYVADTFIAIDERVIADKRKTERRSLFFKRKIQILLVKCHARLSYRRFKAAEITNSIGSA